MPKPVLFIPGFPGSELWEAGTNNKLFPPEWGDLLDPARKRAILEKLKVIDGVEARNPILDKIKHFSPAASTLYTILRSYDISEDSGNFVPLGWDWRQGIGSEATVAKIKAALDDKLSPNRDGKVVAILHSTGGLVFRAFLEREPAYRACFERVLALAVPWCGTLEALHAVDEGAPLAIQVGELTFKTLLSADESKDILTLAQAAYDLFPNDPATGLFLDRDEHASTPLLDRSWFDPARRNVLETHANAAHPQFSRNFDDLPVTNVCGWGDDTWSLCTNVSGHLKFDLDRDAGDGTVNFVSASWLRGANVQSFYVPVGAYGDDLIPFAHGQAWSPKALKPLLDMVLENAAPQPLIAAAVDGDDFVDPNAERVTVRLAATAADGGELPDCKVSFRAGTQTKSFALGPQRRMNLNLSRDTFAQDAAPTLRRMEIAVTWDGGTRRIPLLVQV